MAIELSIIVVNWNGGELLRRSLASVAAHPPCVPYEVVVVDNASTDGTREWLAAQGPPVRLIASRENEGFGRANNRAFAATDAPLLFLLNSDAEVHAGAIDALVETINSDGRIGVAGPRLINPDGTLQASVWRNPTTPFELLTTAFRLYKLMPRRLRGRLLLGYHWDHAHRRRAELLSGAALLVKRKLIEEVGGFDERFHMYGEDTEWCLRIVRAGWWMMFEPKATVLHHGGQSSAKRWSNLEKLRVEYQSFFRFQRLCLPRRLIVGNLLSGWLATSAQYLWRALRRQPRDEAVLVWKLYVEEVRRALFGTDGGAKVEGRGTGAPRSEPPLT
jgi:GT2 family glycosyltransferase